MRHNTSKHSCFRCEHTLANAAGEAQSLTEAGRAFLQVEDTSQMLCCPSFEEHLNAAINCYSHAVRVRNAINGLWEMTYTLSVYWHSFGSKYFSMSNCFLRQVHIENKQTALGSALCLELGNSLRVSSGQKYYLTIWKSRIKYAQVTCIIMLLFEIFSIVVAEQTRRSHSTLSESCRVTTTCKLKYNKWNPDIKCRLFSIINYQSEFCFVLFQNALDCLESLRLAASCKIETSKNICN